MVTTVTLNLDKAVIRLVVEGVKEKSWELAKAADSELPIIHQFSNRL
ncbi:MAG: hypothetical protein V3T17_01200 [Pseudomonadales bacterium]